MIEIDKNKVIHMFCMLIQIIPFDNVKNVLSLKNIEIFIFVKFDLILS